MSSVDWNLPNTGRLFFPEAGELETRSVQQSDWTAVGVGSVYRKFRQRPDGLYSGYGRRLSRGLGTDSLQSDTVKVYLTSI